MLAALFAFFHHVGAFTLASAIAAEFLLIRDDIDLRTARKLLTADLIVGMSAAVVLTAGVLRVVYFEKGADYYLHNFAFIGKLSLFVAVGLLSIVPTRQIASWRNSIRQGQTPFVQPDRIRTIRRIIHLELIGIVLILLCAALMAKGIG